MEPTEVVNQDLLTDDIHPYFQHSHATQGQRFLNFFIDNVLMRLTLTYGTGFVVGKILMALSPELMFRIINENSKMGLYILAYFIIIINYLVYYTLCEKLLRGQTIGKLFTRTKAIRTDGEELAFKDALLRSLCRLIPFETFSGFGVPWHDSLTNTMVVKTLQ
jgi:uncharacterized RDD family membrane protein YckC